MTHKARQFEVYNPELEHDSTTQDPVPTELSVATMADRVREIQAIDSKLGSTDDAFAELLSLPTGYHSYKMMGEILLLTGDSGAWISHEPDWTSLQEALHNAKITPRRRNRELKKRSKLERLRAWGAAACSTFFDGPDESLISLQHRQALLAQLAPCQITSETVQQRGIHLPEFSQDDLSKLYCSPEGVLYGTGLCYLVSYGYSGTQFYRQPCAILGDILYRPQSEISPGVWQHIQPKILQLADTLQAWQQDRAVAHDASERQLMLTPKSQSFRRRRMPTAVEAQAIAATRQLSMRSKAVVQQLEHIQASETTYVERIIKQRILQEHVLQRYASGASTPFDVYAQGLAQQLVASDQHNRMHIDALLRYITYIQQDIITPGHNTSQREYFAALKDHMPKGARLDYAEFQQALLR